MTDKPKVVCTVFYILRMCLIYAFVREMEEYKKLSSDIKKIISEQVEQLIIFYLGYYVELVDDKDDGVTYVDEMGQMVQNFYVIKADKKIQKKCSLRAPTKSHARKVMKQPEANESDSQSRARAPKKMKRAYGEEEDNQSDSESSNSED